MRVLGIDPGYAIVGWGVVDYGGNRFAPVDFGAVCTDAGVPFERRLDEVYTGIKEVIERTRPEVLAIEKLFYQHNQTTVIGVAEARGVILLAADVPQKVFEKNLLCATSKYPNTRSPYRYRHKQSSGLNLPFEGGRFRCISLC